MTLLLTGFDAFGSYYENPSARVTEALADDLRDTVAGHVLPTSYARAGRAIEQLLIDYDPRVALLLGLHTKTRQVVFERVARNRDHSQAQDNDGQQHLDQVIVPGGPDQYLGTLPWLALHDRASLLGVAAVDSDDAGGFVCNHVYYRAAHCVVARGLSTQMGFVHLPECPGSAELDRVVRCIRGFVDLLTAADLDQIRC
jgi:pyroglutamyl-peptidase